MGLSIDDPVHGDVVRQVHEQLGRAKEWFELRQLLYDWDPHGFYHPETDFPPNEYDCCASR
jgi:hypothetical protein